MATLTPEKEDTLNPGQQDWDHKVQSQSGTGSALSEAEKSAFSDIEGKFDSSTANPEREDANIASLRNSEESGKKKESAKYEKLKLANKQKLGINLIKKKGPLGFIGAILIGGGGVFSALLSPGLAIVQIKEAIMDDLNDAVAAMDVRMQHIVRAKMKKTTTGFCTKSASFRCKYRNMSAKQIEKLRKAGITVETDGKTKTGRYRVKSLMSIDPKTGSPDTTKKITAKDFTNTYNKDPRFRERMHTSWSPRWKSINDSTGKANAKKFGWARHRNLNAQSEEEVRKQYNDAVKDGIQDSEGRQSVRKITDEDGKVKYVDAEGKTVTTTNANGETVDADPNEVDKELEKVKKADGSGLKKGIGHISSGANSLIGLQQQTCKWMRKLKLIGMASRNAKYIQLMRYFVPFANTADSIKDGSATPAAVASLGAMITSADMRKLIPASEDAANQQSSVLGSLGKEITGSQADPDEQVKNPHYGDDAFDSATIKASLHGASPTKLDSRESTASLTGGMGGKLTGISNKIANTPGVDVAHCNLYENPLVTGATLVLSLALTVGTGGGNLAVTAAKGAAMMVVGLAIDAFIDSTLNSLMKGDLFNADSARGLDAGNGLFTGGAALTSSLASARGMNPISTEGEIKGYQQVATTIKNQNYELDKIAAADTPFDIYNKASFVGSMAWSLAPVARTSSKSVASMISLPVDLLATAFRWTSPYANAATPSDISRFQKNNDDPVYKDMNLQGSDLMGNIRFGMTDDQLNADPDQVASWMIDARQVDSNTGEVLKTCDALQHAIDMEPNPQALAMMRDTDSVVDVASTEGTLASADPSKPYPNEKGEKVYNGINSYAKTGLSEAKCDEAAERDVRTYAHFLRYCRYGPDDGRTANFGDGDGGDEEGNVLGGLSWRSWQSDGRECLKSKACKPGDNPNGTDTLSDTQYKNFCRPSYYDIYAVYTMDKLVEESFDQEDNEGDGETTKTEDNGALVTGEAKELARQVANNSNIEFVNPATKTALLKFADTGEATNSCGQKFAINSLLSGVLLTNAKKYKIYVNNFGFQSDRTSCDSGQHPKGNAVDLNGIKELSGGGAGGTSWGSITYTANDVKVITQYATDWMDALASKEPTRGRSGQLGCGGYNLIKVKKPAWKGADGNLHFDDSCDHLHIDVGDRVDNTKI